MSKYVAAIPDWARALLVVVAIPALWAMELWMGLKMIRAPQVIAGDDPNLLGFIPTSAFSVALGLSVFWIIYRTPFAVFSLAFPPMGGLDTEGGVQQ